MKITATITINQSIEQVFTIFTDLEQTPKILSGIKSLEMVEGPAQMQVGTRWRETRTMMGKDSTEEMWVSELTQNTSYSVDAESHGTKYHSEFLFSAVDAGTQVTWTFEGKPQTLGAKLMSVTGFIFMGSLRKMLMKDLEELKTYCENK